MFIEEFCEDYYDAVIFFRRDASRYISPEPPVPGAARMFWQQVLDRLVQSDPSFGAAHRGTVEDLLLAVRLEMFGLAWFHLLPKDGHTLPQSLFTKAYLLRVGRSDLWNTLSDLSQIVARSGMFQTAERMGDPRNESTRRAASDQVNTQRVRWFDRYADAGVDAECVARVANRFGTSRGWEKSIGLAIVTAGVEEHLGCEPQAGGADHLRFTIRMLYEGALAAIGQVEIQPAAQR